jgi:hypothetical protein
MESSSHSGRSIHTPSWVRCRYSSAAPSQTRSPAPTARRQSRTLVSRKVEIANDPQTGSASRALRVNACAREGSALANATSPMTVPIGTVIVPNWVRSSSGCGTDDCGPTSATSRPSTMPSPPSTRPSDATGRRSSAYVHKDSQTAASPLATQRGPRRSCLARAREPLDAPTPNLAAAPRSSPAASAPDHRHLWATWEIDAQPGRAPLELSPTHDADQERLPDARATRG